MAALQMHFSVTGHDHGTMYLQALNILYDLFELPEPEGGASEEGLQLRAFSMYYTPVVRGADGEVVQWDADVTAEM